MRKRLAAIALLALSCGYKVPIPKNGPHTNEVPMTVPFPPPAARVEIIGKPPAAMEGNGVWVDGSWEWRGHRWLWTGGRWESPLPETYYARPTTIRMSNGTLAHFPGAWKSGYAAGRGGSSPIPPEPSATAPVDPDAPPAPVVHGFIETTTPTVNPSASPSAVPAAPAAPAATGTSR